MQLALMKRLYDYTVVLRPEDNGTFVAYVPAIPGCHAWGETPEEAQAELMNVFEMIEEEYKEEGRMLPSDVDIGVHACQS
jgi:predicted RNase H-like HicB family nuclease